MVSVLRKVDILLLLVLSTAVVLTSTTTTIITTVQAKTGDLTDGDDDPSGVITLVDDNFDAYVFPKEEKQHRQSWFIFFFAPWCAHCKSLLPQFTNSSRFLGESGMPHAKFAIVNAVKNKLLSSRFNIESYPTFVYTTGKGKQWHKFHSGYSADSFVQFAVYLQRGVMAGSFADIVSDPHRYMQIEKQMTGVRVPMFVYIPPTNAGAKDIISRQEESRQSRWNAAIDAAVSLGNIRFGVLYADDIPANWAEESKESSSSSYKAIVSVARKGCKGTGPNGELFIVNSDAYRTPYCYEESPWLAESTSNNKNKNNNNNGNGEKEVVELHPKFASFLTRNGFRAVEEVSASLFSVVSSVDHHYLGILLTNGTLPQSDTTMMSVLRDIVQTRNDARLRTANVGVDNNNNHHNTVVEKNEPKCQISLVHADTVAQPIWRMRYHVQPEELPAFLIADPRRDKVYRLRKHNARFDEIKFNIPWKIGGEQEQIIAQFLEDVEQGRIGGEKLTFIGVVSELLLNLPGLEFVYETLGYEDALFVTMFFGFSFFAFLLFIALVAEPMMERRMAAEHAKKD